MTDMHPHLIDRNWLFHPGDAADADFMGYDDRSWYTVTLPHDWAVEYPFERCHSSGTGYLPGGIAWYRRHLSLDDSLRGKRVRLTFQGVYKRAKIWFNSNYLGQHAYGYTSFTLDVSGFARPGENVIAVRVDHSETADSRWYTGSGIDRHVFLDVTDPVCFEPGGIFVSTQRASDIALWAGSLSGSGCRIRKAGLRRKRKLRENPAQPNSMFCLPCCGVRIIPRCTGWKAKCCPAEGLRTGGPSPRGSGPSALNRITVFS